MIRIRRLLLMSLLGGWLPGTAQAQYLSFSFHPDAGNGGRIYASACSSCHGSDGRGTTEALSGFEPPDSFPDFTRCDQTTSELNNDYRAVIEYGGPARGFSPIMPAFSKALSGADIDDAIARLRQFCRERGWPRGELNLPRALLTEKAYTENEVVISTAANVKGMPGDETHLIYEQRFGTSSQVEVDVPILFGKQNDIWSGGFGDVALGVKHVVLSSLDTGSIVGVQGGFRFPSGDRARGFGSGTTTFEPFVAFDQLFRTDTFVQMQLGAELPFDTGAAPDSVFFNSAVGQSFAADHDLGRILWSPMCELLMSRDLKSGATADWDILPQVQVTVSHRQHIRVDLGLRVPVNDTSGRPIQVMFYALWDWQDGKFTEGW